MLPSKAISTHGRAAEYSAKAKAMTGQRIIYYYYKEVKTPHKDSPPTIWRATSAADHSLIRHELGDAERRQVIIAWSRGRSTRRPFTATPLLARRCPSARSNFFTKVLILDSLVSDNKISDLAKKCNSCGRKASAGSMRMSIERHAKDVT